MEIGCHVLLASLIAVGRLVLHQGGGTASVEEVDRHALVAAAVRGLEVAIEVGEEVDLGAVELALGQDTGHLDAGVDLGV